jgi:hypothetical protein
MPTDYYINDKIAAMGPLLFDYSAVGLAAFLGSPLAGAVLMAINYRRLRNSQAAAWILFVGAAATGLLIWVSIRTSFFALKFLPLVFLLGMIWLAKVLQGDAVERHVRQGGQLASGWTAAGVGVAGLVLVLLVTWGIARGWPPG